MGEIGSLEDLRAFHQDISCKLTVDLVLDTVEEAGISSSSNGGGGGIISIFHRQFF